MKADLLFLIGYRGTGKTTVGKILAPRMGWDFIDADHLLEERAGKTIREIFAAEGEKSFRDQESALIQELSQKREHIIATGGGVVLHETNREYLKTGFVVWLMAPASLLWERMQADQTTAARRPNLSVGGLEEVQTLLTIREPIYESLADYRISTEGESPESLANAILAAWRQCQSLPTDSRKSSSS